MGNLIAQTREKEVPGLDFSFIIGAASDEETRDLSGKTPNTC